MGEWIVIIGRCEGEIGVRYILAQKFPLYISNTSRRAIERRTVTQVPRTQQIGATGETLTTLQFQKLDWGPVPIGQHDNGTDLLVQIRDERMMETGAILGVQIKTGPSFFSEQHNQDAQTGWIFRVDPKHHDYWIGHYCPHIIVLVNETENIAYWEKITPETTISTGKGWKIFVPSTQKLDSGSKDQLFQYGISGGNRATWEGTIWGGKNRLQKEDQLRAVFLTPRLLAPHVNEGRAPEDYLEALACILTGRTSLISRYDNKNEKWLSARGDKSAHLVEGIYHAVNRWFTNGTTDDLHKLDSNGASNEPAAALAVCRSVAYREAGHYNDAREVLRSELFSPRNFSGGDRAWLLAHYAGVEADLGSHHEAKQLWESVFALCTTMRPNPTVRALMATTVSALLSVRNRADGDTVALKDALNALDNQAYLWVAQLENRGLAQNLVLAAKSKLQDRSITYGANDITYITLRAASLVTGFSGNFNQWRHVTRLLVFHLIVTYGGRAMTEACARWARQCLPADELRQFFSFSARQGIHDPLITFAREFDPDDMTVTSLTSDLALVRKAADYLDQAKATTLARWALKEIESGYPTLVRLGSFAGTFFCIREMLAALYPYSDDETRKLLREHLLRQIPVEDGMAAKHYSTLLQVINPAEWKPADITEFINARAESDHFFRRTVEITFLNKDVEIRDDLRERMQRGDVSAYLSAGPDESFPDKAFYGVLSGLEKVVQSDIQSSERGIRETRTYSAAAELCRLSLMFPENAKWDTVLRFVEPNLIRSKDTAALLSVLISDTSSIPDSLKSKFTQVAEKWMDYQIDDFFFPSNEQDRLRARAMHLYFLLDEKLFTPGLQGQLLAGNNFEIQEVLQLSESLGKLSPEMIAMFVRSEIQEIRQTAVSIATRQWMRNYDRDNARDISKTARQQQPLDTEITMLNAALVENADTPFRDEVLTELAQSQFLRIRERAAAELKNPED